MSRAIYSLLNLVIMINVFIHLPSFLFAQVEKDTLEITNTDNLTAAYHHQYYLLGSLDGKVYYRKGFIKKVDHEKFINSKNSPLINSENPNSHLLYENSDYYNGYLESAFKVRSTNGKKTVRTVIGYLIPFVGIVAGPVIGSRIFDGNPKQFPLEVAMLREDSLFQRKIYKSQGGADAITYFRSGKIKEISHIDFINNKNSNLFNKKNPNNNLLLTNEDYYNGFLEGSKRVKKQRKKRFIKGVLIPTGIILVGFTLAETIVL